MQYASPPHHSAPTRILKPNTGHPQQHYITPPQYTAASSQSATPPATPIKGTAALTRRVTQESDDFGYMGTGLSMRMHRNVQVYLEVRLRCNCEL